MAGSTEVVAGALGLVRVDCPAGTVATVVDPNHILAEPLSSLGPVSAPNNRLILQPDGEALTPEGWQASVVNHDTVTRPVKIAAICAGAKFHASLPFVRGRSLRGWVPPLQG